MSVLLFLLLAFAIIAVSFPYFGYSVWLIVYCKFRENRPRSVLSFDLPRVSFIVSAYNEEKVLSEKLANANALLYPEERIDILVISDASTDHTDSIVESFSAKGVTLYRQEERLGKSAGLTRFVPLAKGEIIVFTDANALFEPDALQHLVSHFSDPNVGYVVGQQKYRDRSGDSVSQSEGLYWKFESWLKTMESKVDSVVGGDGAIYAIRKELFTPLSIDDINDFINPLQIIAKGYRGVYEPKAICYEDAAGSFAGEYQRKVRIANRSIRALFRVPACLNPMRVGVFAFHLFSHKLLRWFGAYFMALALLSNLALVLTQPNSLIWKGLLGLQASFYILAIGGLLPGIGKWRMFRLPFYFCLANIAAAHGVFNYFIGIKHITWTPDRGQRKSRNIGLAVRLLAISLLVLFGVLALQLPWLSATIATCFILYTYVLFPCLIRLLPRKLECDSVTNTYEGIPVGVSVLIPAYNEQDCLHAKIRNTLDFEYPRDLLEIVVIDDASTDATLSIAKGFDDYIKIVEQTTRAGKASSLRAGLILAKHDILLMTDANVCVDKHALRHLVALLEDSSVGCATGDIRFIPNERGMVAEVTYQKMEFQLLLRESQFATAICVDGALYAIKREAIDPPPSDCILDDFYISAQALNRGFKILASPDAKAHEPSCISLRDEFRRRVRLGRGVSQALMQGNIPRKNVTIAWLFFSHKLARWVSPFMAIILILSLLGIIHHIVDRTTILMLLGSGVLSAVALVTVSRYIRFQPLQYIAYLGVVLSGTGWGIVSGLTSQSTGFWDHGKRQVWNG